MDKYQKGFRSGACNQGTDFLKNRKIEKISPINACFISNTSAGSWEIRGKQIAEMRANWIAINKPSEEVISKSDIICIVKKPNFKLIDIARKRNIPLVYDIVDSWNQPDDDARGPAQAAGPGRQVHLPDRLVVQHQRPHGHRWPQRIRAFRGGGQLPLHHRPVLPPYGRVLRQRRMAKQAVSRERRVHVEFWRLPRRVDGSFRPHRGVHRHAEQPQVRVECHPAPPV